MIRWLGVVAAACLAFVLLPEPVGAQPKPIRVGSKAFTESVILGDVVTQVLQSEGLAATHRQQIGGTRVLWEALRRGDIDVYPEYTGTLRLEILGGLAGSDDDMAIALAERGVGIVASFGFDNTYAITVRRELAERLGLVGISDLADHPDLRFGFSNEFMDREDGWPALRTRYELPQRVVTGLDHDLAYRALEGGSIDATDAYATDAELASPQLVVLQDDRRHFPSYEAILLARLDLDGRYPGAVEVLGGLAGRIDASRMIEMNRLVEREGRAEVEAAADFVSELGREVEVRRTSRWRRVGKRTVEHLTLVLAAMLLGVLVALPVGVAAARHRRFGQAALGLVGVVQTVPSLALLAVMVPVLGIGARPAIVALFLYSLLPMVRNTATGLLDIPAPLRDSADALGLPGGYRLRRVDLPLAAPTILAGIKTATVITVGYATLGALVGAGGYGQPILTGIRLNDIGLILEGAVPAAVMALASQVGFDRLERRIVR